MKYTIKPLKFVGGTAKTGLGTFILTHFPNKKGRKWEITFIASKVFATRRFWWRMDAIDWANARHRRQVVKFLTPLC